MVLLTPFQQSLKFGVAQRPTVAIIVMKDAPAANIKSTLQTNPSSTEAASRNIGIAPLPKLTQSTSPIDISNHDILYAKFPKALLKAFIPNLTTTTHPAHGECLILSSVGALAYISVFAWMLACQSARKEVHFPHAKELPYFKASRALIAARDIGSEIAVSAINAQLYKCEYGIDDMVKDLRVVYQNMPNQELRARVGKQIAAVTGFRWYVSYDHRIEQLKKEFPELDDDIKEAVTASKKSKGA